MPRHRATSSHVSKSFESSIRMNSTLVSALEDRRRPRDIFDLNFHLIPMIRATLISIFVIHTKWTESSTWFTSISWSSFRRATGKCWEHAPVANPRGPWSHSFPASAWKKVWKSSSKMKHVKVKSDLKFGMYWCFLTFRWRRKRMTCRRACRRLTSLRQSTKKICVKWEGILGYIKAASARLLAPATFQGCKKYGPLHRFSPESAPPPPPPVLHAPILTDSRGLRLAPDLRN